jgi:hypothetical protein
MTTGLLSAGDSIIGMFLCYLCDNIAPICLRHMSAPSSV